MEICLWLHEQLKLGSILVDLGTDRRCTISTQVFVFVPFRQDQKQLLSDRHCSLTFRTIKRRCFEFLKTGFSHNSIIRKKSRIDKRISSVFSSSL